MSKIVRMEDIVGVVGITNYIEALDLNIDNLKYLGSEASGNKLVIFNFSYEEKKEKHAIILTVDRDKNVKDVSCNCKHFNNTNYCPHVALVIMYFFMHEEIIDQGLSILNNQYDEEFNQYLFSKLTSESDKKRLNMEIVLRPSITKNQVEYELIVKIGENKLYVLKKQLEDFLENYPDGEAEIYFGKNFTYSSNQYYFSKKDEEIIDFLKFYMDSQTKNRSYYGYYYESKITSIKLTGKTLTKFLKLLENRPFKIEEGYYNYTFDGIHDDYPFKISMEKVNHDLKINLQYDKIYPMDENYEYFRDDHNCYHVSEKVGKFLKMIIGNNRRQLLFKENEFGKFSKTILPEIYQLDSNIKRTKEVEEKFHLETPNVKYYFEKKKNTIEAIIKLFIPDYEWNLLEESKIYTMRNKDLEEEYKEALLHYHFDLNQPKNCFELNNEDDIISFLETGLKEMNEKYEVYVSKELKNTKIIKKTSIQSQFGIGRDNILSYQFGIEGINRKEIKKLLDAVKFKKKYYRLKNGSYLDINANKDLIKLNTLVEELDLNNKDLEADTVKISKYKSVKINGLIQSENMEFVKLDDSFENLIQKFNQYKNTEIQLDKKSLSILRDYQETGVKWLMTISNCTFGGILADEMGLGKSLQVIMYIKLKLAENPNAKFLIVVPTSLIYNWENEFHKFEKGISILLMNGQKEKRMNLFKNIKAQVLITSYGLLRQDLEEYKKMHFDTCIIDEAQNIKNINAEITKACKEVEADIKFALTGTPIENSVLELWSIFDFIMPGYLESLSKFKSHYSAKIIQENPEVLSDLNNQISPFILRRKKQDVLKDLPAKLENQIFVELDEEEKKIYIAQLEKTREQIEETLEKEGFLKSQILILSLLTKLRQICIDFRLLLENENHVSSKIKTLLEILKGSILNGHKILVFSQFPSALRLVRQELDNENITYYYLDGSTPSKKRIAMADSFNQDDTNVFLISLKAGGTGLNLTSADVVVHLDPWWNPQVENQATDRSHRIGQKNVVEVIKLIAKGTIEEKIVELQSKKKQLSEQVIEGENRDQIIISKLTEKELRSLLDT